MSSLRTESAYTNASNFNDDEIELNPLFSSITTTPYKLDVYVFKKNLIMGSFLADLGFGKIDNNQRKELYNLTLQFFVTPQEYKNTVNMGLDSGAMLGAFLGSFSLYSLKAIPIFSCVGGELGSTFAGALKGYYDIAINAHHYFETDDFFQGCDKLCSDLYKGTLYGAAVGYFSYHSQYNSNTKYFSPVEKYVDNAQEAFLLGCINICVFIYDNVKELHRNFSNAYQNFNLFSDSHPKNMEYVIAENPKVVELTNIASM
jgi:hypothetical protein